MNNKYLISRRTIGTDKLSVPLLGLGAMRLPVLADGEINYPEAKKIIDRAMTCGVNYFDTAWIYHNGKSENFLADALDEYPRDSYFIADKMPEWCLTEDLDAKEMFSLQLKKCHVSYFDFYLLHAITDANWQKINDRGLLSFVRCQKQEGCLKRLGFSFHGSTELLPEVLQAAEWDFAQIQLNAMDWHGARAGEQYMILADHNVPVVIMEPVRGGALAAFLPEVESKLKKIHPTWSTASWSIRFAASLPNVMTVLSGMSNMEQLNDNINALTDFEPLNETEKQALFDAVSEQKHIITVPCTGCKYCSECPEGIDIAGIFQLYNNSCFSSWKGAFTSAYADFPADKKAENCIMCGLCAAHCPQHIDIPAKLQEITSGTGN